MAHFKGDDPENAANQAALAVTRMQLEMAQKLARESGVAGGPELVPALVIALALNRHASQTAPKA